MNQGTNLGSQIGRWIILSAVVALLGALLLTIRPLGAQEAPPTIPSAETVFNYAENGTRPVTTYRARDPEGNKIFWTLGGLDAASFTIERGALRFGSPPDYENPTDRVRDADTATPPTFTAETGRDNIYRVTVRFGGGGEDGTPGTDDYDGDDLGELDLTVNVINVDEPGRVHISSLQPQIGTVLTATVTDQDGVAVTGSWQWASSDSENGPFTDIPARSGDSTYRPGDADLNKYLRVTARYRDNVSGADTRELLAVSAYPVRKNIVTSNDPPNFPDQTTLGVGEVDGPDIIRDTTERFILENSSAGTRVGAPVTAFDDATEIEVLTYSLSDTTGGSGHASKFGIDPATGQITVSAAAGLNADPTTDLGPVVEVSYMVTVKATDGDGDTMDIDVTIRVVGVDEPPRITDSPREMSHWESDRTVRTATRIDTDLDSGVLNYDSLDSEGEPTLLAASYQDATYAATDPEDADANLRWSLAGPDATRMNADGDIVPVFVLTLVPTATPVETSRSVTGAMATLAFYQGPDFENPWDTNKDNVYEVTLVVTDSVGETDEYDVTVKVINSTDDNKPGKVTILNRHPEVNQALRATFEDPDKPTREVKWQWYRSVEPANNNNERLRSTNYDPHAEGATDDFRYFIDELAVTINAAWEAIPGATSATYTPGYDEDSGGTLVTTGGGTENLVETWMDGDIGLVKTTPADPTEEITYLWSNPKYLRATVTYRDDVDRTHAEADDNDTAVDETLEGTFKGSEYPVKRIDEKTMSRSSPTPV